MDHMTKDSIIYFKPGSSLVPPIGGLVDVSRELNIAKVGLKGTASICIAEGKYLGKSGQLIKVQVTKWTSKIMIEGRNDAWPKNGQKIILKWTEEGTLGEQSVALLKSGKNSKALILLDSAIRLTPDKTDLYYLRGIAHSRNRYDREAVEDFSKFLEVNPTHQDALLGRAIAFGETFKYEEAMADIAKVDLGDLSKEMQIVIYRMKCRWLTSLGTPEDGCYFAYKVGRLDPSSRFPENYERKNCIDEKIAKNRDKSVLVKIISSTDSKEIEVQEFDQSNGCFLAGSNVVSSTEIRVGQLVALAQCFGQMKMSEAVYRVKNIAGKNITLEPWYWLILIDGEPAESKFNQGDTWIVEW
jgi:hypothetical protein